MADDNERRRRERHLELLKKSRDAFEAEQTDERAAPPDELAREVPRDEDAPRASDRKGRGRRSDSAGDGTTMYRGRPIKPNRSLSTPGAGGSAGRTRQFRGAKAGRDGRSSGSSSSTDGDAVMNAIRKLNEMHREGLISTEEFERKRQQLLDRL